MATWKNFFDDLAKSAKGVADTVVDALTPGKTPNPGAVLSDGKDPTVVVELVSRESREEVGIFPVAERYECLLLHGPTGPEVAPTRFNIILYDPCPTKRMFSLFRTDDEDEVLQNFIAYKECLAPLVKIDAPAICKKDQLVQLLAIIRDHPGWTAVHLMAYLDMHKYFCYPTVSKQLNQKEADLNKTPLHIAVERGHKVSVNTLLNLNVEVDVLDGYNNNVLHSAVSAPSGSISILKRLLDETQVRAPALKDLMNNEGFTPLHIACNENREEHVKILLDYGAKFVDY